MGVLDNKYLGEITDLYSHFKKNYPEHEVYFSEYLEMPSCCIEDKTTKYEFYVRENKNYNNEVWLFNNGTRKKEYSGFGYGKKLTNIIDQAESFLEENGFIKPEQQLTLFDFL